MSHWMAPSEWGTVGSEVEGVVESREDMVESRVEVVLESSGPTEVDNISSTRGSSLPGTVLGGWLDTGDTGVDVHRVGCEREHFGDDVLKEIGKVVDGGGWDDGVKLSDIIWLQGFISLSGGGSENHSEILRWRKYLLHDILDDCFMITNSFISDRGLYFTGRMGEGGGGARYDVEAAHWSGKEEKHVEDPEEQH